MFFCLYGVNDSLLRQSEKKCSTKKVLMMQTYDFKKGHRSYGTNTSSESAGTAQPSDRVIQNILNFARCTQCINVRNVRIKLYLN